MLQPKAFKNEPPSHDTQDIKARIDHSNFFYTTDTQIGFSVEVKKTKQKTNTKKENYLTTLTALELNSS